jgi:quercetin dioxygenase-like cupin family protein
VVTLLMRTVRVEPGDSLPYEESEWRDALITVESGELELVLACGRSCFFLLAASRNPELR